MELSGERGGATWLKGPGEWGVVMGGVTWSVFTW